MAIHGTPVAGSAEIDTKYATLAEVKERLQGTRTYTAATLSFDAGTKTITDTAKGLARFLSDKRIQVTGSASNDGYYNIVTGFVSGAIVVAESLVNETAGASITLADVTDPIDDNAIERVITAVSRAIDKKCNRFFYKNSVAEVRYYTAEFANLLMDIDDIVSVSELATDEDGDRTYERTWSATDYDLEPYNAALHDDPYTRISLPAQGRYAFPRNVSKGVKLTGIFGYPAVPTPVAEATLLQVMRLFKRKDALFGVIGSAEMGHMTAIVKLDPDVVLLLDNYRKMTIGGV